MTPERDSFSEDGAAIVIAPAVLAADNTPDAIDMLGWRGATLLLTIGAGGITFSDTNKIEFVLTHSYDGTEYVPVTSDDIITDDLAPATITNGIIRALTAAKAAADLQRVGYIGGGMLKRESPTDRPVITIDVDDIDAALARIEELGGMAVLGRQEVGDYGYAAYFKDVEGNLMGLWQAR